ncbi:phage baseplate assembly protein V [Herbaspirillum sp. RV1423]|uniref:phage baseplate assembly protein V n=1 Tax=Herbaspirillum sp. RV1423 TaxID=1443993 RepID=UPI0004ADFB46|nr:phage baseplate assembly protein V [Herbaspirillum sp. RV1423]
MNFDLSGALRARNSRTWFPSSDGEQISIFSPDGDLTQGKIFSGRFTADFPAPETSLSANATPYADGAVVRYDHATHKL